MFCEVGVPPIEPPEVFAFDSETDVNPANGETMNRLVQMMSIEANREEDAILIYGWNAIPRFFEWLNSTTHDIKIHCFNLTFEFSYIVYFVNKVLNFTYNTEKIPRKRASRIPNSWGVLGDQMKIYKFEFVTGKKFKVEFTDDSLRFGGLMSMAKVSEAVRHEHPELFINIQNEETKQETDYHPGWLDKRDFDFEKSIAYSIRDIFSQSRIAKYVCMEKKDKSLTSTSDGLKNCISIVYEHEFYKNNPYFYWNQQKYQKHFPPLDSELQDIAEESICGGFVFGRTGEWEGKFIHLDYSSSYPYEYAYGKLPYGNIRYRGTDKRLVNRLRLNDCLVYMIIEFDFELKEGFLPCINGSEVETSVSRKSVKQRRGHLRKRLIPETYLDELKHHYSISNQIIHEYWCFNSEVGYLKDFIKFCYDGKNELKQQGKGKSIGYINYKLMMNGSAHGKFITKIHRRKLDYSEGEKRYLNEYSPAKLNFMVGFTAMYSARTRLLRDCRQFIEQGFRIYVCDTDSLVTDCPLDRAYQILGESKFMSSSSADMEHNLGRFEVEKFEDKAEFERLKIWGLKMYLEIQDGKPRKFAFKGAKHPDPYQLMNAPTDGSEFVLTAKQSRQGRYGKVIEKIDKTFKAIDMFESEYDWWDDEPDITE